MYRVLQTAALALLLITTAEAQQTALEQRRAFRDPVDTARKLQMAEPVFPVRAVRAGTEVWRLEHADLPRPFAPAYVWEGEMRTMEGFNKRTRTSALLILKDDKIVVEHYLAGSSSATRFLGYSLSKSFTSTLLGMALEDGSIRKVDEPLANYLPALVGGGYASVTIQEALQMLGGLDFMPENNDWRDMTSPGARIYQDSFVCQRYRYIDGANSLSPRYPPGTRFYYSDMDACLVGAVIENTTRKRLAAYMEEKLWRPAGMEHDAFWALDGPVEIGREVAALSFAATLRDYGRFGLLALHHGKANGRQLISAEWFRTATVPQNPAVEYGRLYEGYPIGYGYYWWLRPNGDFTATGAFGQFIYVAPRANVVIIKQSHWHAEWVDELEMETYAFFDAVVDALD